MLRLMSPSFWGYSGIRVRRRALFFGFCNVRWRPECSEKPVGESEWRERQQYGVPMKISPWSIRIFELIHLTFGAAPISDSDKLLYIVQIDSKYDALFGEFGTIKYIFIGHHTHIRGLIHYSRWFILIAVRHSCFFDSIMSMIRASTKFVICFIFFYFLFLLYFVLLLLFYMCSEKKKLPLASWRRQRTPPNGAPTSNMTHFKGFKRASVYAPPTAYCESTPPYSIRVLLFSCHSYFFHVSFCWLVFFFCFLGRKKRNIHI